MRDDIIYDLVHFVRFRHTSVCRKPTVKVLHLDQDLLADPKVGERLIDVVRGK